MPKLQKRILALLLMLPEHGNDYCSRNAQQGSRAVAWSWISAALKHAEMRRRNPDRHVQLVLPP